MMEVETVLTKDEYERYTAEGGRSLFRNEKVTIEEECGYGFYGVSFYEDNGKYIAVKKLGSSCD